MSSVKERVLRAQTEAVFQGVMEQRRWEEAEILLQFLAGEGLNGHFRPLASLVERSQIGANGSDGEPGKVLHHVHPMGADVPHRPQCAVCLGLDAPVEIRVVEQPVLRVGTLDMENRTQFAAQNQLPDMLYNRVETKVVANCVSQVFLFRQLQHFLGLSRGHGERFFAKHGLARVESGHGHGVVQRIGRQHMDGVNRGVFKQSAIVAG